jgi:hypothetical protein
MDGVSSAELGDVGGADFRWEGVRDFRQRVEHMVDDDRGRLGDELLGHRLRGCEE